MTGTPKHAVPASQPALVLIHGTSGAANRRYSLDQDAVVIGKARGCDLVLEANDISNVHCLIGRNAGGWSVRDCSSRSGTKLNGERIEEGILQDGDLLQLGPFSFRAMLPPPRPTASTRDVPVRLLRLERKRLRLAKLALGLRERLQRTQRQPGQMIAAPDVESSQLTQQAELLRQRLRECELRAAQLEQAGRELANDRAALTREMEEYHQQAEEKEKELEQRRLELERQHKELMRRAAAKPGQAAPAVSPSAELDQQFRKRQVELEEQYHERRQELELQHEQQQATRAAEVAQRQAELEKSFGERQAELEQHVQHRAAELEQQFATRRKELEQDLERRRAELEKQLRQQPRVAHPFIDLSALEAEEDLEKTIMLPMVNDVLERTRWLSEDEQEESRRLLIRRRELDHYHQYLRRTRDRLGAERPMEQHDPDHGKGAASMETNGHAAAREHQAAEQTAAAELIERQQTALTRAETMLNEQRAALEEMMDQWRQILGSSQPPTTSADHADVEALVRENDELRRLLQEQPAAAADGAPAALDTSARRELEQVRGEFEFLQKQLDEKNAELQQLREQNPTVADMPAVEDVDSYEAELVQYRRQLEIDRDKLDREVEQVKVRNQELDEATREVEMELSRERAELARERIRLDRLREEIQSDLERLQRNGDVMERLVPVQKLREEMAENRHKPPVNMQTPSSSRSDPNMMNTLRNLRK